MSRSAERGAELLAGVARADITPLVSIGIFGYGEPTQIVGGLEQRLHARAFAFRDGAGSELVYVCCELGFVSMALRAEVLRRLGARCRPEALCLSATHTHAAPGGHSEYLLYNASTLGSSPRVVDVLATGIVEAVERALDDLAPARVTLASGELAEANYNRTPGPHRSNPDAADPAEPDTDRVMKQLAIWTPDGRLRGVLNWYAVHCTSHDKHNRLISSDNKGYAAAALEAAHGRRIVAAFAQANGGDVSPNRRVTADNRLEGEGASTRESVRIIGERQLRCAEALLEGPQHALGGPVEARLVHVGLEGLEVPGEFTSTGRPERLGPALMGQNFLAGTKDGRGPAWFEEGDQGHALLVRLVARWTAPLGEVELGAHRPKRPFLSGGEGRWMLPAVVPIQLLRLGALRIVALPFELSTVSGRRLRQAVATVDGLAAADVVPAALSNAYAGYVTTPEEYDHQHYEGASTLFGREQLNALRWVLSHLAGPSAAAGGAPPTRGPQLRGSLALPARDAPVDLRGADLIRVGAVFEDAPGRALPGTLVSATFWALPPSLGPRGSSLVDVERAEPDGTWRRVHDDRDWCTLVRWRPASGGLHLVTCQWEIPRDTPAGTYRLAHRTGPDACRFEGLSRAFEVAGVGTQVRQDPADTLFAGLSPSEAELGRSVLRRVRLADGDMAITEGERDRAALLVRSGQLSVRVGDLEVSRLGAGHVVGELALFLDRPRSASLVAIGEVEVDVLDADGAAALLAAGSPVVPRLERLAVRVLGERLRRQQHLLDLLRPRSRQLPGAGLARLLSRGFRATTLPRRPPVAPPTALEALARVAPLHTLASGELAWLAAHFAPCSAVDGEVLCAEGEPGETLFLVVQGEVEAMLGTPAGGTRPLRLGWMRAGDLFGLIALADGRPRSATCVARGPVELLLLSRAAWELVFEADRPAGSAMRRLAIRTFADHMLDTDAQLLQLGAEARVALAERVGGGEAG